MTTVEPGPEPPIEAGDWREDLGKLGFCLMLFVGSGCSALQHFVGIPGAWLKVPYALALLAATACAFLAIAASVEAVAAKARGTSDRGWLAAIRPVDLVAAAAVLMLDAGFLFSL